MNGGWVGKILRIDLTDGTVKTELLNLRAAGLYAGGRGLGMKYYADAAVPEADPLGPENVLIFMTGPLTGTLAACSGMYSVVSKAPSTGTAASCCSGGNFGPELKFAGYDGIIVKGKAKSPVYLYIHDDGVELRSAGHLWGRNVPAAAEELMKETNESAEIVCIGPEGEQMDLSAAILNDNSRTAERLGFGAVMGAKNLKAIAVRGTKSIRAARRGEFLEACLKARDIVKANPVTGTGQSGWEAWTPANIPNGPGAFLAGSWQRPCCDLADDVRGEAPARKYPVSGKGCFGSFCGCGTVAKLEGLRLANFGKDLNDEADRLFGTGGAAGTAVPETFRNLMAVVDSMGICPFTLFAIGLPEIAEMFRACTGSGDTGEELLRIGERIRELEAGFRRKSGSSKQEDRQGRSISRGK